MGRPKKFNRGEVLEKALPLFWKRGFADTGLQDLEKATGVNKSGLYSEFKDKDEIYVESLRHYLENRREKELLSKEPFGWSNIESFIRAVSVGWSDEQRGCFGVNSVRELAVLPGEAQELVSHSRATLRRLFVKNISHEKTKMPAETIADFLSTYFSGLCIE